MSCSPTAGDPTAPTTTVPTSVSLTTSSLAELAPPCRENGYVASGPIGRVGDSDGDAGQISGITLEDVEGCERITVDFATRGGAPATRLTPTQVELLEDIGVVRISFNPSIQSTALAESVFEGSLAERAYVVRGLDGRLFIDLLLVRAAEARVAGVQTPAQLEIELRAGNGQQVGHPAISELVVVTSPSTTEVAFPLEVAGYARTFEGNVVGRLTDSTGVRDEQTTTAAAYIETWGAFLLTVDGAGEGPLQLFVGSESPSDGSPVGVTLDLNGP